MQNPIEKSISLANNILFSNEDDFSTYLDTAKELTLKNFGNNRKLFNPIYISNICNGDCLYCGYRKSNKNAIRLTLSPEQTYDEALFLYNRGIKNILFLAGEYEHDNYLKMLVENISYVTNKINFDWIGVEVASLCKNGYKELKRIGVNSVTLFQETYDLSRYNKLHPSGVKSDFFYRLHTLHRAAYAGINEVGLGVLYGVSYWHNDTLAMIQHGLSLKKEFPSLKLRFSFPRLMHSECQDKNAITEPINEKKLIRILAAIRIIFPDSSFVLTGRESSRFLLNQAIYLVDTIGKAGTTTVGGYTLNISNNINQFELIEDDSFSSFTKKIKEKFILL